MCKFISLWHRPDNGDIAVWDLNSHSDTSEKLKLKEPLWCEGHYLPTGEVELRVTDRNFTTQKDCENRFKNRFPSFFTFLNWCLNQSILSGSLYLSGCTIPDGFKLPDTVGGSLDLSECTIPNGFKIDKKKYNII